MDTIRVNEYVQRTRRVYQTVSRPVKVVKDRKVIALLEKSIPKTMERNYAEINNFRVALVKNAKSRDGYCAYTQYRVYEPKQEYKSTDKGKGWNGPADRIPLDCFLPGKTSNWHKHDDCPTLYAFYRQFYRLALKEGSLYTIKKELPKKLLDQVMIKALDMKLAR